MTSGLLIPTLRPNSDFARDMLCPWNPGTKLSRAELEDSFSVGLNIAVGHHTKRGKYVEEQTVPGHSIVQVWTQALSTHMGFSTSSGHQTLLDVTNVARTTLATGTNGTMIYRTDGGVNAVDKGIVCGTGTGAVAQTDYALGTLINAGNGAGQLAYAAQGTNAISSSGTSRLITLTRAVTNNSGGAINVTEVGLYCYIQDSGNNQRTHMLCRDLLSFTVGIGATKTVTYTITVALT